MNLNTQQIVLLCLLVSFVTATSTGITVVSLMQQSPEPVTQTINRVIERTVERVAEQPVIEEIKEVIKPSEPKKEVVTVVVNQEDQSINAVEKNEKSIARVVSNNSSEDFMTLGMVLNQAGDLLVDKRSINTRSNYKVIYAQGTYTVSFDSSFSSTDLAILKISGDNPNNFSAANLGDSNTLKLAQSVISLSGANTTSVSVGEVSSLNKNQENNLISVRTSVNASNVLPGSVILNLSGHIVGFRSTVYEDRTVFVPINSVKSQLGM
jgi:hypothetical protein